MTDLKNQPGPNGAIDALRVFAWITLIASAGCAIAIWADLGTRPRFAGSTFTEANPFGIVLGIIVGIGGASAFAFFLTVCKIAETLLEIRRELKKDSAGTITEPENKALKASE